MALIPLKDPKTTGSARVYANRVLGNKRLSS
jgi:hypothetical protein